MRRALLLVLLLGFPTTAGAQTAGIMQGFDSDGDPLVLSYPPSAQYTLSWSICRPAEPCIDGVGHDYSLSPGPQPAGTTFKVTMATGTTTSTATSDPWGGPLVVTRPNLVTTGVVGTPVDVTPGPVDGGWPTDSNYIQLQVCDQNATCVPISDNHSQFPAPVTLEPRDAGRYVQAVIQRIGTTSVTPGVLYSNPRGIYPLKAGPGVTISLGVPITPAPAAHVETSFGLDGNPVLFPRPEPRDQSFTTSWSICRPAVACVPGFGDQHLDAGAQPAGTTFAADITYKDGAKATASSPAWGGPVTSVGLPTVQVSGSRATGAAGTWSGGWADDQDFVQLQVCRPRNGCVVISDPVYGSGKQGVLKPEDAGGYVAAFDRRQPASTVYTTQAYGNTRDIPPLTEGPTVAMSGIVAIPPEPGRAIGTTVGAAVSGGARRTPNG